ncbi:MAG TPA: efflux transporter outer membrane subunit [Xanthobacteraceae bacterium]|nr:efflux transporter outer membrane subunit [Xanthobacteraceae bacterium]
MLSRVFPVAVGLTTVALVAGCAVGPDFERPAAPDAERYTREPLGAGTASAPVASGQAQRFVNGLDISSQWWTAFRSPALNSLIERSIKANPTLESTIAALRVAQESARAQEGKFFPLVQGNFNPTSQQVAQSVAASSPLPSGALNFNLYTAQVLVSYTFDVWGLNRRTVESLQAQADSQHFLVEAAYLTLAANVAAGAIQEASLRAQIATTLELININTKMLTILRQQLATGQASRIDVAAQEAALAQVVATLPPLRKALLQQRDLLAALAGRFPSEEPPEKFTLAHLHLTRDLPVTVPSRLIEQRPDVRSAEELLHSSAALVGVSIANILPSFTINATGGYVGTQLAGLASPENQFWTVSGNVTQTLFDAGALLHEKRAAEAAYDSAAAAYRAAVIAALQNVADTLRAIQQDALALKAAVDFERAAKISLDLVTQQMLTGYANILLLLNAQQAYLQARLTVIQAQAARLADTVALFQALGGGWWNRPPDSPTQPVWTGSDQQPIGTFAPGQPAQRPPPPSGPP